MDVKNGYPFSLIRNGLLSSYPRLTKDITTEVLVVGGGFSGALISYLLTAAKIDCIVVEKHKIGLGNTCYTPGFISATPYVSLNELADTLGFRAAARVFRLCSDAIEDLKEIMQKTKFKDFQKCNTVSHCCKPENAAFLNAEFELYKKAGLLPEFLSADELQTNYGLSTIGGILLPNGLICDLYKFTHHLFQYSSTKGLEVYTNTNAITFNREGDEIVVETENGPRIFAGKVIFASETAAAEKLQNIKAARHINYNIISEEGCAALPATGNKAILRSFEKPFLNAFFSEGQRLNLNGRIHHEKPDGNRLRKCCTELKSDFEQLISAPSPNMKTAFQWYANYYSLPDGIPGIGTVEEFPNIFFNLGLGLAGNAYSIIAAEMFRDAIMGYHNRDAEVFSLTRKSINKETDASGLAVA